MVTAKTTKKPAVKKTVKKVVKKEEKVKLSFYHDAFKVIAWASGCTNSYDRERRIWQYAGAIRGPDSESEQLKNVTTAVIRGYSEHGNDIHSGRLMPKLTNDELRTLFSEEPSSHFKYHISSAFYVLEEYYGKALGKKNEAAIFHRLSVDLPTHSYKEYLENVKLVTDNWDDTKEGEE